MITKDTRYLLLIISIFISAVIETDIYLPAFSDMMLFFNQSEESIQRILTWNFFALCVSGPIYGPLSDSFGRYKLLIVALSLFVLGSIITLFSAGYAWVLVGRVIQGLGSGGCFTLGTAIIFDVFRDDKATGALNKINMIMPFLMSTAPLIGGYLNEHYGFRSNFLVILVCATGCLFASILFLRETLEPIHRAPFQFSTVASNFYKVLTNGAFLRLALVVSLIFAAFFVFLSTAAILFVLELNVEKSAFPFYQSSLLFTYLVASLSCSTLIKHAGITFVKRLGISSLIGSCCFLALVAWLSPTNPKLLTAAMLPYGCGFIWVQTPYVTDVMELLPSIRGISASVLTSLRLLITAAIVGLTARFYNSTAIPMILAICLATAVAVLLAKQYESSLFKSHHSV